MVIKNRNKLENRITETMMFRKIMIYKKNGNESTRYPFFYFDFHPGSGRTR